jgi:hypothetical protein
MRWRHDRMHYNPAPEIVHVIMTSLTLRAGPKALAHLHRHGLRATDIAIIPAAAGGPKGLIFQHLDQWLFGEWLASAPRERTLIGASIGAWRMAAACHDDAAAAFRRFGELYCAQRYPRKPSPQLVTDVCRRMLADFLDDSKAEVVRHPYHRLQILVSRGNRLLAAPGRRLIEMAGFGAAVLSNAVSRARLASHLQRVVIGDARNVAPWLKEKFDAFDTHFSPLSEDNLQDALLASGTLPFVMEPVTRLAQAPAGTYWDGGLIDYHLDLPYSRAMPEAQEHSEGELALYPHFEDRIVPGWFDKQLPWRRAGKDRSRGWFDNVLLVSPSREFLSTLPRGKIPDRRDFIHYGLDDERRIASWKKAIAESERLRDALAEFAARPDLSLVKPIA